MKCPSCGNENRDNKFCKKCGARLVAQIDESISASERSKLEAEIKKERAEKEVLRLQQ